MSHLMRQSGSYSYGSCIMVLRDKTKHMDVNHIHVYVVTILFWYLDDSSRRFCAQGADERQAHCRPIKVDFTEVTTETK